MAAYSRPHVTCRLTAEKRYQLRNPMLGNRVWATFFTYDFSSANDNCHLTCSILLSGIRFGSSMNMYDGALVSCHQQSQPSAVLSIPVTLTHAHTRLTALCPRLPGSAGARKVKPIWILLEQETVSGSGISWVICKSAPCSRQTTTQAPRHSVFYRPDALLAAQPTVSKH